MWCCVCMLLGWKRIITGLIALQGKVQGSFLLPFRWWEVEKRRGAEAWKSKQDVLRVGSETWMHTEITWKASKPQGGLGLLPSDSDLRGLGCGLDTDFSELPSGFWCSQEWKSQSRIKMKANEHLWQKTTWTLFKGQRFGRQVMPSKGKEWMKMGKKFLQSGSRKTKFVIEPWTAWKCDYIHVNLAVCVFKKTTVIGLHVHCCSNRWFLLLKKKQYWMQYSFHTFNHMWWIKLPPPPISVT